MRLRGNHDCRGFYAEKIGDYIPLDGENTFFKFHLGPICGVALDCGEDKEDSCAAYGHTVCCHPYREAQTDFLNRTAEFAQNDDAWEKGGLPIGNPPCTVYQNLFPMKKGTGTPVP